MALEGPRGAKPEELPAVTELVDTVFRNSRNLLPTMGPEYPLHLAPENAANLWIMLDNGRPVSHYGVTLYTWLTAGCAIPIAAVGAVATDLEYRGQGLATQIMQACEVALQAQGIVLELISGTRGLYRRNNAIPAGEDLLFTLDYPSETQEQAGEYHIRSYSQQDFRWIQATYQQEPARYLRTPEEWRKLLARNDRLTSRHKQETLVIEDARNTPLSYLVADTILPTTDQQYPPGSRTIVEYAGARHAIAAAYKILGPASGQLRLQIPLWDTALIALLQLAGYQGTPSGLRGHTIKMLNFPALVDALAPHFLEAAGAPAGSILGENGPQGEAIFLGDGERVVLPTAADVVHLLFGSPDGEAVSLPENSRLASLLRAALPIPVPIPGLNYT